ncbi:hypothetical protein [Bradyrhizobium japonicum]|uniref:hypothetical protein n=1 Tax=Bradyrhizobium japonicum TaxID=375 RepID=UPI001BA60517|nr:hypothetical protein [Bradyrhizobium japonicum]MBR0916451.1 hypothetical protein [Bradyrhizobium japonicum]
MGPLLGLLRTLTEFCRVAKAEDVPRQFSQRAVDLIFGTAPELMAWFGWKTITEAQRYIEEANRIRLAESAANKVRAGTAIGKPPNQFAKETRKSLKNKRVKS